MGTQARVTPEGLRISRRVVTSKVRHAPAEAAAAQERVGRARRNSTIPADAPALVFTNIRLSMHSPSNEALTFGALSFQVRPPHAKGHGLRVKSAVPIEAPVPIGASDLGPQPVRTPSRAGVV